MIGDNEIVVVGMKSKMAMLPLINYETSTHC